MHQKLQTLIKASFSLVFGMGCFLSSHAQTVIASAPFNGSQGAFTSASGLSYQGGNSTSSHRPANLPFFSEGTQAGACTNTQTILSTGNINTTTYCNNKLSFRLAAWSLNNTSNGLDESDIVLVEISTNGGSSYTGLVEVTGNNNAFWHYSTGTGIASVPFSSTAGVTEFTPTSGGNRTTDGYSTVEITNLPRISNLRVRITLENSNSNERWTIDDFKITGDLTGPTPTIGISTSSTNFCTGANVTFSSTVSNAGTTPTYQWRINGNNVSGANSSTFTTNSLTNGAVVSCVVTSSENCNPTGTSGNITMTATGASVTPTVSISVNTNNVCAGTTQNFSSSITNGGSSPSYQWTRNGSNISGASSSTYSSNSLSNGDVIGLVMTSNATCRTSNTATASTITAQINANVTPTASISVNTNNICAGTTQNFTSSITNGGASPSYQWTRNGSNISGATASTYSSSALANGDVIGLVMTSNATCRTSNTASATNLTMQVRSLTTATASVTTSNSSICPRSSVTFNSNITNGGSNPTYSWRVNGVAVGTNSSNLVTDTFTTAKTISLVLTPSADACPNNATTSSNNLNVTVLPGQNNVTASSSSTQICRGSSVQLNASASTTARFDTAFIHGFESNQSNWTLINGSTGGTSSSRNGTNFTYRVSTYNYGGNDYISNDNSRFVFANSENHSGATNVSIISPSFSTIGFSSANLEFFHYYNDNGSSIANVSISTNGTSWTSLQNYSSDIGSRTNFSSATISIPAGFLNQSTVFVRFNYMTSTNERYWAIDNVLVSGTKNHAPTFSWDDQNNSNVGNQANISNYSPNQTANLTLTATNIFGCSSTQSVAVQVDQPTQSGSVSGNQIVCRGINAGVLQVSNQTGAVQKWQWSTDGNVWNDVTNTTNTLSFSNLTTQRQFRAELKNGVCSSNFTPNFPVNVKNKNWTGDFDNNWFDARNWCGGIPDSTEDIEIPSGALRKPNLTGNVSIQNLDIQDTIFVNQHVLKIKGNITGNGHVKTTSLSTIEIEGNGNQVEINFADAINSIGTLKLNRANGLKLNKSVRIHNSLELNNGKVELGNQNATFEKNAVLNGGNSNSYLRTNGTGQVTKDFNSNESFTFKIGNASYNPTTVKNNDGGIMGARVEDQITTSCNGGNVITQESVNRTWHITKSSPNVNGVDLTFEWTGTDELNLFNRNLCYASHCNSANNTWEKLSSGSKSAAGTGPFSISYTNYMGTFSPFGVGSGNGALPVTWVQVAAKKANESTLVTWSTASEKGTDRFEIERSLDGKKFEKIGQVAAVGNSNTLQNYSFRDAQNIPATTFYRIKSVDFDGTTEYSKTVSVQFNALQVSTFPNPTTGKINLQGVENAEVEIVNALGKIMNKFSFNGNSNSEIDLTNLPDGIYFISITQNQTTQQIRVVKSNP